MIHFSITEADHIFGNPDAKVIVVVYEDYECEKCGKSFKELKELREYFKEQICIVYRHFPYIKMHPSAIAAALLVEACSLQNKFLQAHDLIFEYQEFLEYGIGGIYHLLENNYSVSIKQLMDDLKKEELNIKINNDIESGIRCAIKKTPAIFINDRRYQGKVKFNQLSDVVKNILKEKNEADTFLIKKSKNEHRKKNLGHC